MKNKKFIEKIKKINWEKQRFNAYPFFLSSTATLSGFKLPWGLYYKHFLCISKKDSVEWFYDTNDFIKIGKVFWQKIKKLEDLLKLVENYEKTYKNKYRKANYKLNSLENKSVKELKNILKRRVELLQSSAGIGHIIECATFFAEKKMIKKYNINIELIKPARRSFLFKAGKYAYDLQKDNFANKEILNKFLKKYSWINTSYLGKNKIDVNYVKNLIKNFTKNEKEINKNIQFFNNQEIINILSYIFYWQDKRKENILKSIYFTEPVLDVLAKKIKISKENIKFILPEEIDKIDLVSFQKELELRTKIFIDYAEFNKKRVTFVLDNAKNIFVKISEKLDESKIIKGQVAYSGKIRAKVRVCLSLEAINNLLAGEILVASMTRPEYLSAMHKASAIITDEGGITCHAAIIAREMKKPCIIGTKNATQILKDGDLVEVDADKGIIKILKK